MKDQISTKGIYDFCKELWPINRSLTGPGVIKTLELIQNFLPDLKIHSYQSGTKKFDWIIPDEWKVNEAWIKDDAGNEIINFNDNNLHLVGYSEPISKTISLNELNDHLHSRPDLPDAIPYVTSYYKRYWGFCMSHKQREKLSESFYQIHIDTELKPGLLNIGELVIPGETSDEFLISTNICHPSMANNEISGIAVATWLARWLANKKRKLTYRILYVPETIGSIAYIHDNLNHLKQNTIAGINLVCCGDDRTYSYLPSRNGGTIIDRILKNTFKKNKIKFKEYTWLDRGSDERQYCAPGVDLPVATFTRSKYAEYPEYHTSLDTLGNVVNKNGLKTSLAFLKQVIDTTERTYFPKINHLCEPFLLKYNLSDSLGGISLVSSTLRNKSLRDILTYADGNHSIEEIAIKIDERIETVIEGCKLLKAKKLIK
jgi:aminopeptidase-like protein